MKSYEPIRFIKKLLKIKAEVVMIDMISEKLLALAVHVLLRDGLSRVAQVLRAKFELQNVQISRRARFARKI